MSCHTLLCWSMNTELSGESRKEVNVSGVMMRTEVGLLSGWCCGDAGYEAERDGVAGRGEDIKGFGLVDALGIGGIAGTSPIPGTTEYRSKTTRSSSWVRRD
jgi:hypothetical protein